jgi:hypothetical protein
MIIIFWSSPVKKAKEEEAMSFKENLLKKFQVNQLARQVLASIGPPDSGLKLDKEAMRSLLEMSPFKYLRKRDLDLYIQELDDGQRVILVLDNELPIYRTTIEDVAIRKSPYVGEMVKIRNIIKILKDSDVKISRKDESVKAVQQAAIKLLDLSYNQADIEAIAGEGASSLENGYAEGVKESLALFSELLGYQPAPKPFQVRHHEIFGGLSEKPAGEIIYGPVVLFSLVDHSLRLLSDEISSLDKTKIQRFQQAAEGNEKASIQGVEVFRYLKEAVMKRPSD